MKAYSVFHLRVAFCRNMLVGGDGFGDQRGDRGRDEKKKENSEHSSIYMVVPKLIIPYGAAAKNTSSGNWTIPLLLVQAKGTFATRQGYKNLRSVSYICMFPFISSGISGHLKKN